METSSNTIEAPHVPNFFTFALYFSEKKSKQLRQFLDEYPFVVLDDEGRPTGASGAVAPQLNMGRLHIRGLSLVVSECPADAVVNHRHDGTNNNNSGSSSSSSFVKRVTVEKRNNGGDGVVVVALSLYFVDNLGGVVDPSVVDCLLQKASVDKDEGREYVIDAIQAFCDEHDIKIVDHFEPSMAIVASRSYIARQLAGGPYDTEGSISGKTAMETLGFWGFLPPSTYYVESSSSPSPPSSSALKRPTNLSCGNEEEEEDRNNNEETGTIAIASTAVPERSAVAAPVGKEGCQRVLFEEPNPFYRPDVVIMKPEVASQRDYSHDLCVVRARDLVAAADEGPWAVRRLLESAVDPLQLSLPLPSSSQPTLLRDEEKDAGPAEKKREKETSAEGGTEQKTTASGGDESFSSSLTRETRWVVQECVSLLALPVVYKVYVAGDYLSVMCYDAREFTERVVRVVSEGGQGSESSDDVGGISGRPVILKGGAKGLFKPLITLADRRAFQGESSLHAECVQYFAKGTKNYDDLWQTVQFLKRPDHLGVQFFGLDVLVVKGVGGEPDRRYIVDVNYLPSYKNEMPARLFPALLKAMMEVHH